MAICRLGRQLDRINLKDSLSAVVTQLGEQIGMESKQSNIIKATFHVAWAAEQNFFFSFFFFGGGLMSRSFKEDPHHSWVRLGKFEILCLRMAKIPS